MHDSKTNWVNYYIYSIYNNVWTSINMYMVSTFRMVNTIWTSYSNRIYSISMYYFIGLNYENKESQQ